MLVEENVRKELKEYCPVIEKNNDMEGEKERDTKL